MEERSISTNILDIDLEKSEEREGYPWVGSNKAITYNISDGEKASSTIRYMTRLHVGEKTMGGNYSIDIYFNKNDILSMFIDMFRDITIEELAAHIKDLATGLHNRRKLRAISDYSAKNTVGAK